VAFIISPAVNLATGEGMFPGLDTAARFLMAAGFLVVACAAAYVGARRGEALYAYNQRMRRGAPR
jgi:hypothetical protein